jgi:hypothetical protein
MNTIQTTTEDASMGTMKTLINDVMQDVMTLDSSPEPVLPPVIKLPLARRTFTLDGLLGGHVAVSESPDFQSVILSVCNAQNQQVEIQLDSEHFGELSYLRYQLFFATEQRSPF